MNMQDEMAGSNKEGTNDLLLEMATGIGDGRSGRGAAAGSVVRDEGLQSIVPLEY